MKFIFLDFDGVLNNDIVGGLLLDPNCVELLNDLVRPDIKFVVSSTWRRSRTVDELTDVLQSFGFKGEVFDKTPILDHDAVFRGNEIYKWMSDNNGLLGRQQYKFTDYVILDDDSDMLYWQRNNFICVDASTGITRSIIYQCKRILKLDNWA